MPGIVGVLSSERSPHHERSVMAMLSHMTHEPFYDCGTCFSHEIGVYAGWTAHKNSQAALQNQLGSDQAVSVVLAGECVTQEGQSVTDLATLYSRRNSDFIAELNGQFSGLLVDRPGNQAILFNDRYGVERLYVYEAADDVFFASEAKALLAVLPELRRFDDGAVAEFVGFGCTLNWKSLFHSLNFMQGGTSWTLSGGTVRKQRYFDRSTWERQPALRPDAFDSELADTFSRVMPRHVRSDLPVGISLTGGLDTRMIMACLPTAGPEPVCYTFSGQYGATLDERVAAHVAAICQLDHHVLRLNDDFLARFGQYVDRTVYVTDGCSGPMAAHEIYLNSMARQLAPVRLTGNFGSEILRGVSTLKPRRIASALLSDDFRAIVEDKRLECAGPVQHPVAFMECHATVGHQPRYVGRDLPRLHGRQAQLEHTRIF